MISVGLIMFFASLLSLRQYEVALRSALQEDLVAHAVTLQLALEEYYLQGREKEIQNLIDRIHRNTEVYSILLYDRDQQLLTRSMPLRDISVPRSEKLGEVLRTGRRGEASITISGSKFATVIVPITMDSQVIGAVELLKPLSLIETDIFYARFYWILTTVAILSAIFIWVFFVLRRNLTDPIDRLLKAFDAMGKGELHHKVEIRDRSDEIGRLAARFNEMGENLDRQYNALREETDARIELEREIRHNEQLVSVGRLAAGVAHELGAPLNVIDGRAEQLLKRDLPEEKRQKNLETIRSNVARMAHLIRQLLNLAKPFKLNVAKIELNSSINSALEQLEWNIEAAKITLHTHWTPDIDVVADGNYLLQVWLNIFINAVQEMDEGGELFVRTYTAGDFGVAEIKDTGSGIPEENFVYLFDPFFTTKDIGKGTGLGLPIANRIVEEHGGKINATNSAEGGAQFTVLLPLFKEGTEYR